MLKVNYIDQVFMKQPIKNKNIGIKIGYTFFY